MDLIKSRPCRVSEKSITWKQAPNIEVFECPYCGGDIEIAIEEQLLYSEYEIENSKEFKLHMKYCIPHD